MRFTARGHNNDTFSITNAIKLIKQLQIKNETNILWPISDLKNCHRIHATHGHGQQMNGNIKLKKTHTQHRKIHYKKERSYSI